MKKKVLMRLAAIEIKMNAMETQNLYYLKPEYQKLLAAKEALESVL